MASVAFNHLTKKVLVEVLKQKNIMGNYVYVIKEEEGSWMSLLIKYLSKGIEHYDDLQARKIRAKAESYVVKGGVMYRKGVGLPWLRCVILSERKRIIEEQHSRLYGAHEGERVISQKIIRTCYFWLTMSTDTEDIIQKCEPC